MHVSPCCSNRFNPVHSCSNSHLFAVLDRLIESMLHQGQDTDVIRLSKDLIRVLNWGPPSEWHNSMYKDLSGQIFEKTGEILSPTTLKRFFGVVQHEGKPSISTLDILAQFLEFENWRSYKTSGRFKFRKLFNVFSARSFYISLGFGIALVTIMLLAGRLPQSELTIPPNIEFSSRPVTKTYPNSVVFDFDLKGIEADSARIQQYWDETKTIDIDVDQRQATGIYYRPGYFGAKLIANNTVVREHDLFLKSDGWIGTIDYAPVPTYYQVIKPTNYTLSTPMEIMTEVAELEEPIMTTYHFVDDLGNVSADDLTVRASIRHLFSEKWAICQVTRIYLLGTDGAIIVPLSTKGCSSDNGLMLNDVYVNGKTADLSAFSADQSEFANIRIENRDKTFTFFIEDRKVYQNAYNETIGNLVGLRFRFVGVGEVANLSVLNKDGIEVEIKGL